MKKFKCTKCKIYKKRDDFYKDKQKRTGYRPDCKECNKKQCIKWSKNNPEKRKFYVLKSATGVSKKDYLELLKLQDNKCAICNCSIEKNGKKLSVDHNHNTNYVRGLLCTKCNFGLGYFNDNKKLLLKAIDYLSNNYSYIKIKYKINDKKI